MCELNKFDSVENDTESKESKKICFYKFSGVLQKHKWENAMTIDKQSWGFRRNARLEDYFTTFELISEIASTVSCGGAN